MNFTSFYSERDIDHSEVNHFRVSNFISTQYLNVSSYVLWFLLWIVMLKVTFLNCIYDFKRFHRSVLVIVPITCVFDFLA